MGTDFSLGRLGAPGLQVALGDPRGTVGPEAALGKGLWVLGIIPIFILILILIQNRSAQVGEDVTKIASP